MKHITRLRKICRDLERVENYTLAVADNFRGWVLHHRLELTLEGAQAHTAEELDRLGMYYGRPHFELIFLKRSEHITLHNLAKSKSGLYEGRRSKISAAVRRAFAEGRIDVTGERNGMFGKHSWNSGKKLPPLSEEVRAKLSEAHRGCTPWNKGKALSEEHKQKLSEANRKPKSEHMRKALSEARKEYWKNHKLSKELIAKMAAGRVGKKRGPYKKTWATWYVGPDGKRVYV